MEIVLHQNETNEFPDLTLFELAIDTIAGSAAILVGCVVLVYQFINR